MRTKAKEIVFDKKKRTQKKFNINETKKLNGSTKVVYSLIPDIARIKRKWKADNNNKRQTWNDKKKKKMKR